MSRCRLSGTPSLIPARGACKGRRGQQGAPPLRSRAEPCTQGPRPQPCSGAKGHGHHQVWGLSAPSEPPYPAGAPALPGSPRSLQFPGDGWPERDLEVLSPAHMRAPKGPPLPAPGWGAPGLVPKSPPCLSWSPTACPLCLPLTRTPATRLGPGPHQTIQHADTLFPNKVSLTGSGVWDLDTQPTAGPKPERAGLARTPEPGPAPGLSSFLQRPRPACGVGPLLSVTGFSFGVSHPLQRGQRPTPAPSLEALPTSRVCDGLRPVVRPGLAQSWLRRNPHAQS